jgi:uncharacterized iron-regulated protein
MLKCRNRSTWLVGLLWLASVLGTVAHAQSVSPPPTEWASPHARDHTLVGKIWSRERADFVTHVSLINALVASPFVLLGEVHDNADAHTLQGWAISQIKRLREHQAKAPPFAAVVFEHIRTDQQDALTQFVQLQGAARQSATTDKLFELLDWSKSGWPAQDKFQRLFQSVTSEAAIYAANPSRQQVRAVARGEDGALSAVERTRILLDAPWDKPLADALFDELKGSHCGAMPESAVPAMIVAQRYRDAAFADVMLTAAKDHGAAILIAGNGHVRTDRAVPWYLRQRSPGKNIIAVMMLEVEDGQTDPAAYAPRAPDGKPAVDFIVFTPRAERPDPCEALRQRSQPKQ